jgi:hypothetical protein
MKTAIVTKPRKLKPSGPASWTLANLEEIGIAMMADRTIDGIRR